MSTATATARAAPPTGGGRSGTALLVRLALRRDRAMVPAWFAVLLLVCFASAAAVPALYGTEADRVEAAQAINASPGLVALYGPILDVRSTGELAMTKMTVLYAVFVALMVLFVVRRHTRLDEENGQAELVGGTAVTRTDPLTAAVLVGGLVSLTLGLLAALVTIAGGLPAVGSLAFGGSWAGTALVATGITALACQVSPSSRVCAATAAGVIGVLYVLRAVGDTSSATWLSWLSPFGWNTQLRAWSGTSWWVLLLYVALAGGLVAGAVALQRRRDLAAGLVAPRPGPAVGSPRLADAVALSLRANTTMLVGWSVALAASGVVFGAITPSFDAFDTGNIRQLFERLGGAGAFRDTLLAAIIATLAIVITCFAVAVVGHGGTDEHAGRTEQVLATATSRARAFAATVVVALAGATWLLLVAGVSLAAGVGGDTDHSFWLLVGSALAQAPAVWSVTALAVLCLAAGSRYAVWGWGVVVLAATLGEIGHLLELPSWVGDLSPFTHAPQMPAQPFEPVPALVSTGVAAAVLALAWLRYRSRDIG